MTTTTMTMTTTRMIAMIHTSMTIFFRHITL